MTLSLRALGTCRLHDEPTDEPAAWPQDLQRKLKGSREDDAD